MVVTEKKAIQTIKSLAPHYGAVVAVYMAIEKGLVANNQKQIATYLYRTGYKEEAYNFYKEGRVSYSCAQNTNTRRIVVMKRGEKTIQLKNPYSRGYNAGAGADYIEVINGVPYRTTQTWHRVPGESCLHPSRYRTVSIKHHTLPNGDIAIRV